MSQNTESEGKIAVEEENAPEIMTVFFDDENAAQNGVRILNKALRSEHRTIYQGALLSRDKDNALTIRDLRDMGLGELITGTADLTLDTSRSGLKLTWAVVSTGVGVVVGAGRLAKNTFNRAMGLLGSFFSIPSRRRLERFNPDAQVQELGLQLPEGKTAVIIVADHETAAELTTDLVRSGGALT
jgi:hypothetical protein